MSTVQCAAVVKPNIGTCTGVIHLVDKVRILYIHRLGSVGWTAARRLAAATLNDFVPIYLCTRWPKKLPRHFYALPLPNINRFSKLFHCQNQEEICNNTITKDPTKPQECRYTTLWNVRCLKSNNWKQDDFCNNSGPNVRNKCFRKIHIPLYGSVDAHNSAIPGAILPKWEKTCLRCGRTAV